LNAAQAVLQAIHWLGVGLYIGSFAFLTIIFHRIYWRYKSYKFVDNFRAEVIQSYWKFLHIAFAAILVSGVGLAGLRGKSILSGTYGLVFSTKLVLWLVQIYLSQEALKPFLTSTQGGDDKAQPEKEGVPYALFTLVLLLLISLSGFVLKYL
jgi:hypothetical protein